jgi:HlyD family secretion protein
MRITRFSGTCFTESQAKDDMVANIQPTKNKRLLPRLAIAALLAAAVMLSGCETIREQIQGPPTPTPIPTPEQITVNATGKVVPAQKVMLSFTTGGTVTDVPVAEGDTVAEGDLLAQLNDSVLQAQIEQAQAALAVAEASLEQALAGPHEAQIAEAENQAQAANAATVAADAQRDELEAPPEQSVVLQQRTEVQSAYMDAERERDMYDWVNSVDVRPDQYTLQQQEGLPDQEPDARRELEIALRDYEAAQASLESLLAGPNEDDVRAASADVWAASADYQAALAEVDRVAAGPREEQIAVAEAAVASAEAALESARIMLDNTLVEAPFAGTATRVFVHEGEYVQPGASVVELADLSTLRVETTDLNEIDVAEVQIGDKVTVTFDALPGVKVGGTVTKIAPRSDEGGGVNYTVTVELDSIPERVRWGMTAFVAIPIE